VVNPTLVGLETLLGEAIREKPLWTGMKEAFVARIQGWADMELAETFFNSLSRRVFTTVGVDVNVEFVASETEELPEARAPIFREYLACAGDCPVSGVFRRVLQDQPFEAGYEDLERDASRLAISFEKQMTARFGGAAHERLEVLKPVFFRNKGAYLVGRVVREGRPFPLVVSLLNPRGRVAVDALLLEPDEASIVFSFTRSYFHVEVDRTGELIAFLRSILPQKPTAELYLAIGYNKHGKTVLYRDIVEHLARTSDRFATALGDRGMVMIVFALPSLDFVFKVIRDRFAPPKNVTRQEVKQKYALVFRHDRAGRLVDAQEFEHLVFDRARFEADILEELLEEAGETCRVDGERVFIRHLYAERRVSPLNLFIREKDEGTAREALLDYGQALRDLAATNTFPGDLLLKNFGVTRSGRVIFYDYDELCLVTDCNFRDIPRPRDDEDEWASEPTYYVGENDVFPEEFVRFLGLPEQLRGAFEAAHAEILTADFWRRMQAKHRAGEIVDIFPYRDGQRLRHGRG